MAVKSLAQSSLVIAPPTNSLLGRYQPNAFHHLETVRLSAAASSISFTNLSNYSDYQHFQLRISATGYSTYGDYYLTLNGDTTNSNYYSHSMYSTGGGVGAGNAVAPTINYQWSGGDNVSIIDIFDCFDTSKFTTMRGISGNTLAGAGANFFGSVLWRNTAVVTSLTYSNTRQNHGAGSRFSLYGLKAR